jgi:hypothetical protein
VHVFAYDPRMDFQRVVLTLLTFSRCRRCSRCRRWALGDNVLTVSQVGARVWQDLMFP